MEKCERGSISLYLLVVSLLMTLLTHMALLWSQREFGKTKQRLLEQQLRQLNNSYFLNLKDSSLSPGQYQCFAGVLQPGSEPVEIIAKSEDSTDGLINFFQVQGTAANLGSAVQRLCRLSLNFSESQRLLAGQYALASKTVTGLEYLPQEAVYKQASTEEVKLPQVRFFYNKAASAMTADEAVSEGLSRHFNYLDLDKSFVFKNNSTLLGETVFVNKSSIEIGSGCAFADRVAIYSQKGNIIIGNNVRMNKALIHAYGTVSIGTGCTINGLIIANKIILKGTSSFSADADVVAPFVSCAFTN